jgi:PAP2 superfamily
MLLQSDGRKWLCASVLLALPIAAEAGPAPEQVQRNWYRLTLELVRHTPTYAPPVASRGLAYIGIISYEAAVTGRTDMRSLAGQLNGLTALPQRDAGGHDEAVVQQAALAHAVKAMFANTGPTGQRAMAAMERKLQADVTADLPLDVVERSTAYGIAVADHVLAWAATDGGAVIENLGFPTSYIPVDGPANWVPTSKVALQQAPLLPAWGDNRTFAMPKDACPIPPPPAYSEDPTSEFFLQAKEVFDVKANLTSEQTATARFWADDAMLSTTPPGHWISIAMQILERDQADLATRSAVLARLGIGMADGFIGTWDAKYQYNLLRPITYIRRTMDPRWESLLNTPPFPEYPSGHSVQSAAAATVLTAIYGEGFAFNDATNVADGAAARDYPDFWTAAHEAGISRLYGGIHFRAAIENGLEQGRCIGAYAAALEMKK